MQGKSKQKSKQSRNRSAHGRIRPGSARERGNVWVPMDSSLTGNLPELSNKFKMTKSDSMFGEMEKKFKNLSVKRRSSFDQSFASSSVLARSRRSRNSDYGTLTTPYPSGSCHTVITGEDSTFCITSNFTINRNGLQRRFTK